MDILVYGINGKMGAHVLKQAAEERVGVLCGIDKAAAPAGGVPVFPSLKAYDGKPGVIVDFSRPDSLSDILSYAVKNGAPVVLCTTGYTDAQQKQIEDAAQSVKILKSGNMSLGVNLAAKLVREAFAALGASFDVEIIEKHHNQKADAPSGTALLLADAMQSGRPYIYGRHGDGARGKEIAVHAVRGGTIVGEHEVIFAGGDEILSIKHTALSRRIFAVGALKAARFLHDCKKPHGLFSMNDAL